MKQVTVSNSSDSQSAIHLTKNQGYHKKSKHFDVRLHFIRDLVMEKRIKVEKIHTDDNPADYITKSVSANKFQKCLRLIGVSDLDLG